MLLRCLSQETESQDALLVRKLQLEGTVHLTLILGQGQPPGGFSHQWCVSSACADLACRGLWQGNPWRPPGRGTEGWRKTEPSGSTGLSKEGKRGSLRLRCENDEASEKPPKNTCSQIYGHLAVLFVCLFCFCPFRAAPATYGGSQARGLIRTVAVSLCQSHSNAGSLTCCVRPGIKPTTSLFLVAFVSAAPRWELLVWLIFIPGLWWSLFRHPFILLP